ncbi:MAG: hypothetical protein ACRDJY_12470 [Thermoleophilaceae bacterium]
MLAIIRPNEWELPLFIHVLGALAVVGGLTFATAMLFSAWRDRSAPNVRLALRSLTLGVLPAFVVLRGSAEWIADKEGYADLDEPPDWIEIGYIVADAGFLLILIPTLLAWAALGKARADIRPGATVTIAAVLISLALVANLIALWAMTTRPG